MTAEQESIHRAALNILKKIQQTWGKEHSFLRTHENNFKHLDLVFYRKIQKQMETLGFTLLGNIEDLSIKESKPDPRTFIRILINADATISAAIYHAKPKFPWPILCWFFKLTPLKVFEFETEFENGITLTTSIAAALTQIDAPQEIVKQFCDKKSTVKELFNKHTAKMKRIQSENNTQAIKLHTLNDICLAQNRTIHRVRKHMEQNGWVSKEYLIRQHGKDDTFINDVYEEVQRLVRKQLITGNID